MVQGAFRNIFTTINKRYWYNKYKLRKFSFMKLRIFYQSKEALRNFFFSSFFFLRVHGVWMNGVIHLSCHGKSMLLGCIAGRRCTGGCDRAQCSAKHVTYPVGPKQKPASVPISGKSEKSTSARVGCEALLRNRK